LQGVPSGSSTDFVQVTGSFGLAHSPTDTQRALVSWV
jgi:hypothetical protein